MSQIKAIETNYAGCRFRSRLEARWAVFFDRLGVPWEYEPQGFEWPAQTVDDGYGGEPVAAGRYLPDFWLPSISTWFEVKGQRPSSAESTLHRDFHRVTDSRHICAWGSLPSRLTKWGWEGDENSHPLIHVVRGMERDGGEDFHYLWCVCPICGKPGIEFDGRGARVCRWTHAELAGNDKGYTHDHPRIREAFVAALSARFEHGESGAPVTPCHRCGRPGVRDIGTRGYCADHLAELVGTFHPTAPGVGLQTGLARPELGAGIVDLTCCRCQAGWSGPVGQTCWYCQQRTQKQEEHQIDLLLTPPDSGNLAGWAARLAVAVRQGLITEEVAARAVRRADAA